MDFAIADGKVVSRDEINLASFVKYDTFLLKHCVWFGFGGIPLLIEKTELIRKQCEELLLPVPNILKNQRELFRIIKRMLNKNKFYRSGYVWFQFFWNGDQVNSLITSSAISTFEFPFLEKGILLDYSPQKKYSGNRLNRFSFYNQLLWKADLQRLKDTGFDSLVVLNEKNEVCECTGSNIFLIKGNALITPALGSGCYDDVLRPIILNISENTGLNITESENIKISDLMQADEIFTAAEEKGINWVLGIGNNRFVRHQSLTIHKELNHFLKEKVD